MLNQIKKEVLEGIRTYKFLILTVGILFFAFLDPLMLKILPSILESQYQGINLADLMNMDQPSAAINYIKSLYQTGTLVVGFALMSILAGELKEKTTTIPYCAGMRFSRLIWSKFIVYVGFVFLVSTISTIINYFYAASLFEGRRFFLIAAFKSGLLFGLLYAFLIACLMFFGSIFRKPNIAGLLTVVTGFLLPSIGNMLNVTKYTPGGLLSEARFLVPYLTTDGLISVIVTTGLIIALMVSTIERMKYVELN